MTDVFCLYPVSSSLINCFTAWFPVCYTVLSLLELNAFGNNRGIKNMDILDSECSGTCVRENVQVGLLKENLIGTRPAA